MTTLGQYWASYDVGQSCARRDWDGEHERWWWDPDLRPEFAAPGFEEGFEDELSHLAATDPETDQ